MITTRLLPNPENGIKPCPWCNDELEINETEIPPIRKTISCPKHTSFIEFDAWNGYRRPNSDKPVNIEEIRWPKWEIFPEHRKDCICLDCYYIRITEDITSKSKKAVKDWLEGRTSGFD